MSNRSNRRELRWSDLTPAQQAAVRRRRAWSARHLHRPPREDDGRGTLWHARRPLFVLVMGLLALIAVGLYSVSRSPLPKAAALEQTSFIMDDQGHPLTAYGDENRVEVPFNKIPKVVVNAVVSTEDRHFFTEGAIDPAGILRALIADAKGNGNLQGGSTITQQYVKQAYLNSQRTVGRKLKEADLAIKLGHKESKDQILGGYLNTIYLGRSAYGIEAAAHAYFGKDVTQLNLADASLLAGLIREPDNANPATNPSLARAHQTDTLNDMIRDGKINRGQASAVEKTPFSNYVVSEAQSSTQGPMENLPGDGYYLAAVYNQLIATYGANTVNKGGLRVTTTLDPTLQTEAFSNVYGPNQPQLNPEGAGDPSGALVSVDNTGAVKAMVGGQDYSANQVNLALGTAGGGSGRQPGSTFKAFMLAEVLKEGYTPNSEFPAPGEVIVPNGNVNHTPWQVTNFEGEASATSLSLIQATEESVNTVYAQVVEKIGPQNLDAMAEACGIDPDELKGAYPSQVLGTASVSPLEMAAAYATFANGGIYNSPILFTKVTTASGKTLPLPKQVTNRRVLDPTANAELTGVLQQVVVGSQGTGSAAGGLSTPVAGKTGTSTNAANDWFIGYTPHLTTAVWMGYPTGNLPITNFRGETNVQGGQIPAELWHDYMAAALKSDPALGAPFAPVYSYPGNTLQPPDPTQVQLIQNPTTTTTVPGQAQNPEGSGPFAGSSSPTVPTTTTTVPGSPTATTTPAKH